MGRGQSLGYGGRSLLPKKEKRLGGKRMRLSLRGDWGSQGGWKENKPNTTGRKIQLGGRNSGASYGAKQKKSLAEEGRDTFVRQSQGILRVWPRLRIRQEADHQGKG